MLFSCCVRWNRVMNVEHAPSYKPPSNWSILFRSGGRPNHFSCLKNFRALVVPSRGFRKGIIIQGIMTPTGVLPNGKSFLWRKGDVMGAPFHAPIQRNSTYVQTFRRSIYKTRRPEQPHSSIRRCKRRPQGLPPRPRYRLPRNKYFHYRSLILILMFLLNSARLDTQLTVHQCAWFSADPKLCHNKGLKRIFNYIKGTAEECIILKPDPKWIIKFHIDTDFSGGWSQGEAKDHFSVLSSTGYVISYSNCPILWSSRIQTYIALSITEVEYIALSKSM